MADLLAPVSATMRALVSSYGSFDAVVSLLEARGYRGAHKGTISLKATGQRDWSVADVIALEDALGRYPVTDMLQRRKATRALPSGDLISDGSAIARESGEAIAAILAAAQSSRADETADAIREVDDAIAALRNARARLEARNV